jgi:hypothetical protein
MTGWSATSFCRARGAVGAAALALSVGCPIVDNRDGIGRLCKVDDACPIDHFCAFDGPVDADDEEVRGVCAPVLDYGGCDAPAWPVKDGKKLEGNQRITAVEDLIRFDGVTAVIGDLRIERDGPVGLLELGDLCGLAGLQRVTGAVVLRKTDVDTLDGLQALSNVGGGVAIVDNPQLQDAMALANLQVAPPPAQVGDASVAFVGNAALRDPAVEELRAALDAADIKVAGCENGGSLTACTSALAALRRVP